MTCPVRGGPCRRLMAPTITTRCHLLSAAGHTRREQQAAGVGTAQRPSELLVGERGQRGRAAPEIIPQDEGGCQFTLKNRRICPRRGLGDNRFHN